MSDAALHGRWEILAWEQRYDDGRVALPLGADLTGFIDYAPDGHMVCLIARKDRPRMSGGQWTSSDADKAAAYSGYFVYAGTYEVQGDVVSHHVETSLFPNWEGGVQKRRYARDGDRLDITARLEEGTSEARTALLAWRRAGPR